MTPPPSAAARTSILAASALTIMAAAIIAPSLPAMAAAFAGAPNAAVLVKLALTITSLAIAITAPVAGALADRIGRRPLLLASLALYAVAGVSGFFITDLGPLLASRALLGVAVGGIMTAVGTIITDWFEGARRASFLALQQASASLGGVIFLPLAGALAEISWHAPFLLYAAGLPALALVLLTLREPRTHSGAAASASRASKGGVAWRIAGLDVIALVVTTVFFMAPTQLPFSLRAFGASSVIVGIVIAASTATGVLGALLFPRLNGRVPSAAITAVSVLALGLGWALIGTATGLPQVIAGVLLGGVGVGLAVPDLNHRLAALAPPAHRGRILSTLVSSIFLGQFLSPVTLQPLIGAIGIPDAFIVTGAVLVAGAIAALVRIGIRRTRTDSSLLTSPTTIERKSS